MYLHINTHTHIYIHLYANINICAYKEKHNEIIKVPKAIIHFVDLIIFINELKLEIHLHLPEPKNFK